MQKKKKTKMNRGAGGKKTLSLSDKSLRYICLAFLLLLLFFYIRGFLYYRNHFHRNTYINGVSMKGKTVDEAERYFNEDFASHDIKLVEKERTETIRAREVVEEISTNGQVQKIFNRLHAWNWFTDLFGKEKYTVTLQADYDEARLRTIVNGLDCFKPSNVTEPRDAHIVPGKKAYKIVPEVIGNQVDKEGLLKSLETAISQNITKIDLEKEDLYVLPRVYAKDKAIKKALKEANKYALSQVIYDFNRKTETVDYALFKDWIVFSEDLKVSVDEDKVSEYILGLAAKYNTMGRAHHFKTSSGKIIRIDDGDYGWKIDTKKEKKQLVSDIQSGKKISRKPFYSYEAMGYYSKVDDIGNSYVEVDIRSQKLWLYINGRCKMRSAVVTGDVKRHYDTEKGVYSITYKESPSTLTGVNSNGSAYSSDVKYWMPFNGNQGLHDAPWRMTFGGSEYEGNGSHGCVNCPVKTAKVLYDNVKAGFPVVIY